MHSPTYKHGNYTKLMQIKLFTAKKSIEIALNKANLTKSKKTSKTRQKFDFRMEPKIKHFFPHVSRSLLCIRFVAVAFRSEEEVS